MNDSFILQCRQNYFDEIYPSDENIKDTKGYKTLKDIAQSYFEQNKYEEFAQNFMEGQYFIQLWTAHLILEYGNPDENLTNRCLDQIKKYSQSTLSPKVAIQEMHWLEKYNKK